jgi:hypothetical protein
MNERINRIEKKQDQIQILLTKITNAPELIIPNFDKIPNHIKSTNKIKNGH